MGLTRARITKYEAENDREPRVESRGTKNMIHDWLKQCDAEDQIDAFCKILRKAGLLELASDLSGGIYGRKLPTNVDLSFPPFLGGGWGRGGGGDSSGLVSDEFPND